jgi:hypothetical protein
MAAATFCWASPAIAQAVSNPATPLDLSATVRARYESLSGQFRPGLDRNDSILSFRTTLLGEYRDGPFRLVGEIYDSRAYGAEPGSAISTNEVNAAELVQAFVAADFDRPIGDDSKAIVQLGRMTLNIGSRRLLANDDYRNTTNGFTGVKVDLAKGSNSATLLYLLPQQRRPDDLESILDNEVEPDRESFRLRLWGGLLARKLGRNLIELTFLRLAEQDTARSPTRDRRLNTVGLRLSREPKPGRLDYDLEAIRQTGGISASLAGSAPRLAVRAGFSHAELGYTLPHAWRPHLSLEYDVATGDGPEQHYGRFDTLYGMRRADLGPASLYSALGRTNIRAPGMRVELVPSARLDAMLSGRLLWAQSKFDSFSTTGVRDPTGNSGGYAGEQLEGRLRYWLIPKTLRAEANAVWLRKGALLRDAPNAPAADNSFYQSVALTAAF